MTNKIILLISLFSYAIIVSQPFMYILALRNTQLGLGGESFTEVRQLIDANMRVTLKYALYLALVANLVLLILNSSAPSGLSFITAAIAFAALVADVVLTLKGSIPINNIINNWAPHNYPDNWQEIRDRWFRIFQYRQIITIIGFSSLVIGAVFGKR